MRVKLVTLRFAPSLGGFDDRPLADFVRDKEVLAVREHFFVVHELPHLACLVTYQDSVAPPGARTTTAEQNGSDQKRRKRADPTADLARTIHDRVAARGVESAIHLDFAPLRRRLEASHCVLGVPGAPDLGPNPRM